jgi:hypothetical protein
VRWRVPPRRWLDRKRDRGDVHGNDPDQRAAYEERRRNRPG